MLEGGSKSALGSPATLAGQLTRAADKAVQATAATVSRAAGRDSWEASEWIGCGGGGGDDDFEGAELAQEELEEALYAGYSAGNSEEEEEGEHDQEEVESGNLLRRLERTAARLDGSIGRQTSKRRRSISLNDILDSSYVHESASGERIIISRGWPTTRRTKGAARKQPRPATRHKRPQAGFGANELEEQRGRSLSARRISIRHQRHRGGGCGATEGQQQQAVASVAKVASGAGRPSNPLSEEQKRSLLMEFLSRRRSSAAAAAAAADTFALVGGPALGDNARFVGQQPAEATTIVLSSALEVESALKIHRSPSGHNGAGRQIDSARKRRNKSPAQSAGKSAPAMTKSAESATPSSTGAGKRPLLVHYELPVHAGGQPIAL